MNFILTLSILIYPWIKQKVFEISKSREIQGRFSAHKRKILIRGTLETSEEGSLEIDFMLVANGIESTFYQSCTKCRTEVDCSVTEKYDLITTKNTFRE